MEIEACILLTSHSLWFALQRRLVIALAGHEQSLRSLVRHRPWSHVGCWSRQLHDFTASLFCAWQVVADNRFLTSWNLLLLVCHHPFFKNCKSKLSVNWEKIWKHSRKKRRRLVCSVPSAVFIGRIYLTVSSLVLWFHLTHFHFDRGDLCCLVLTSVTFRCRAWLNSLTSTCSACRRQTVQWRA